MEASNVSKEIERQLPNATLFMYTQASGGVSLIETFKSLSKEKEYKEISKEASYIVERVEYFQEDLQTAISEVAKDAPSEKFREFLETLTSVVQTGSSLSEYFSKKYEEFRTDAEMNEKRDLETLGLLAESYVIVLGLGPLLIIVMMIVLSLLGIIYTSALYVLIYGLIPLGTGAFLIILDTILVSGIGTLMRNSLHINPALDYSSSET